MDVINETDPTMPEDNRSISSSGNDEASSYAVTPPTRKAPTKTPLFQATHAERYARQDIIRRVQTATGRELICYVAGNGAQVSRDDTLGIVDLLHNVPANTAIDFLVHSPGGDIDAAEKLITIVRTRAGSETVRVIVPDYAKSAATLIALGADVIVMSDTSELGVVDPQVELLDANGHRATFSAQSYLDAFEAHSAALRDDPQDPVAALMLNNMDAATVRKLERITTRSKSIATDLLSQAMMSSEDAVAVAAALIDTKRWHSHGQMISYQAAISLGLSVTYLAPDDSVWADLWQLYCLQKYATADNAKMFESALASVSF